MSNLITSQEVIDIAFSGLTNMRAESINDAIIHVAELRYIRPAFGVKMFDKLSDDYAEFTNEYVKPALAFFAKCEVLPSLSLNLSNGGVALANPQYSTPATDKQRTLLYESEFTKAQTLLDEALRYVTNNIEQFPDYEQPKPKNAPRTHRIGGIIL